MRRTGRGAVLQAHSPPCHDPTIPRRVLYKLKKSGKGELLDMDAVMNSAEIGTRGFTEDMVCGHACAHAAAGGGRAHHD